jgi:hypothetical protein
VRTWHILSGTGLAMVTLGAIVPWVFLDVDGISDVQRHALIAMFTLYYFGAGLWGYGAGRSDEAARRLSAASEVFTEEASTP